MVRGTGSWIDGWLACGLTAGGTWITSCRLATGAESREMMWSSFFYIASWFSRTCICLLAIAVSSSCSVDLGVDTSFQGGCSRSQRTDPMRLAVAMLLLVVSSNSPQDGWKLIRLSSLVASMLLTTSMSWEKSKQKVKITNNRRVLHFTGY